MPRLLLCFFYAKAKTHTHFGRGVAPPLTLEHTRQRPSCRARFAGRVAALLTRQETPYRSFVLVSVERGVDFLGGLSNRRREGNLQRGSSSSLENAVFVSLEEQSLDLSSATEEDRRLRGAATVVGRSRLDISSQLRLRGVRRRTGGSRWQLDALRVLCSSGAVRCRRRAGCLRHQTEETRTVDTRTAPSTEARIEDALRPAGITGAAAHRRATYRTPA